MKRDWEVIRKQLIDIEEENDVVADIRNEPKWGEQSEAEFKAQFEDYEKKEAIILGHLELLINSGYVEGLKVRRATNGNFIFSSSSPRLTMAGHDLLDTMRSSPIWESIKKTAKEKGIELTFDAIKSLGKLALGHLIG